ncbi:MAG: recombination mediator RecR [Eubacteriales bacterium]
MSAYIESLARLINELSKLPGVGKRSATRLAYHILEVEKSDAVNLANAIIEARENVTFCQQCGDFTQDELCPICSDRKRDRSIICVVSDPRDVGAMERTGEFSGLYHVLHGTISPNNNKGPDDIRLKELLTRLAGVKEIIVATNPDLEGEATAMYIAKIIKPLGIAVSRIAHGVPVGSDLQYADEITLGRALVGRVSL